MGCRPFTDHEIKTLVNNGFTGVYQSRDRAWFAIGINTGFRISEILSLKVGDVWRDKMVVRHLNIRKHHMKGKKHARTRKIHDRTRAQIRTWLRELTLILEPEGGELPKEVYLFQSREGSNKAIDQDTARKILSSAMERIGIVEMPYVKGTHMLRKTYARRVYEYYLKEFQSGKMNGEPILLTQRALGHMSIDNTLKYLSFLADEIPSNILDIY